MVATLIAALVISFSCQKTSVSSTHSTGDVAKKQKMDVTNFIVEASTSEEENFDMVMAKGEYAESEVAKSSCKTITFDPSKEVYPHTKTIDFGAGCATDNGATKSGKVIITYYDYTTEAQGKFSVTTYDNYYVNGVHIEGSIQVNKVKNGNDHMVYEHIIRKTLSDANGNVKDYNTNSVWTVIDWNGGVSNAYEITQHSVGSETYNGVEANNFQTDVDEANLVIKPFGCKRVQGGLIARIHLTHVEQGEPNDLDEYLDYGNGDCDNLATLSINGGAPEQVTIPLQYWPLNL